MKNWEIRARSRFCCFCETAFESGQGYHCLLDLSQEEPVRSDYCERCWKDKDLSKTRGEKGVAYWRANFRRISPVREKFEPIEKDLIQRLLNKYINSEDPNHINLCYILALLQERKKILTVLQIGKDEQGNRFTVYEHRQRGDTFLVRDPELSLSEAEEVEAQIKILLNQEKVASDSTPDQNQEGNVVEVDS